MPIANVQHDAFINCLNDYCRNTLMNGVIEVPHEDFCTLIMGKKDYERVREVEGLFCRGMHGATERTVPISADIGEDMPVQFHGVGIQLFTSKWLPTASTEITFKHDSTNIVHRAVCTAVKRSFEAGMLKETLKSVVENAASWREVRFLFPHVTTLVDQFILHEADKEAEKHLRRVQDKVQELKQPGNTQNLTHFDRQLLRYYNQMMAKLVLLDRVHCGLPHEFDKDEQVDNPVCIQVKYQKATNSRPDGTAATISYLPG